MRCPVCNDTWPATERAFLLSGEVLFVHPPRRRPYKTSIPGKTCRLTSDMLNPGDVVDGSKLQLIVKREPYLVDGAYRWVQLRGHSPRLKFPVTDRIQALGLQLHLRPVLPMLKSGAALVLNGRKHYLIHVEEDQDGQGRYVCLLHLLELGPPVGPTDLSIIQDDGPGRLPAIIAEG